MMEMKEEIILSGERRTTWTEVRRAILSNFSLEDIVEAMAFGSCVRPIEKKVIKGKYHPGFLGFFSYTEPEKDITVYPNDIDVLVITRNKPVVSFISPKIKASAYEYGEACGYGFSYLSTGYKEGFLHCTIVSENHFKSALKRKDKRTLSINKESFKII